MHVKPTHAYVHVLRNLHKKIVEISDIQGFDPQTVNDFNSSQKYVLVSVHPHSSNDHTRGETSEMIQVLRLGESLSQLEQDVNEKRIPVMARKLLSSPAVCHPTVHSPPKNKDFWKSKVQHANDKKSILSNNEDGKNGKQKSKTRRQTHQILEKEEILAILRKPRREKIVRSDDETDMSDIEVEETDFMLRSEFEALKEENARLKKKLSDMSEETERLSGMCEKLKAEKHDMQKRMKVVVSEGFSFQKQLSEMLSSLKRMSEDDTRMVQVTVDSLHLSGEMQHQAFVPYDMGSQPLSLDFERFRSSPDILECAQNHGDDNITDAPEEIPRTAAPASSQISPQISDDDNIDAPTQITRTAAPKCQQVSRQLSGDDNITDAPGEIPRTAAPASPQISPQISDDDNIDAPRQITGTAVPTSQQVSHQISGAGNQTSASSGLVQMFDPNLPLMSLDKGNVHLGHGFAMKEERFNLIKNSKKDSIFCQSLAVAVWGVAGLRNRSVTGGKSNRYPDCASKLQCTPEKMKVIEACLKHRMKKKGSLGNTDVDIASQVKLFVKRKIDELNRDPERKKKAKTQKEKDLLARHPEANS